MKFAFSKNILIADCSVFLCHEVTPEAPEGRQGGSADIEIAVPISGSLETVDSEKIRVYELPGGKVAKTVHKAPYEDCSPTYEKLFSGIAEKGKRIAGPICEVYFNDPREVPTEETITEIYASLDECRKLLKSFSGI